MDCNQSSSQNLPMGRKAPNPSSPVPVVTTAVARSIAIDVKQLLDGLERPYFFPFSLRHNYAHDILVIIKQFYAEKGCIFMDGVFCKQRFTTVYNTIGLISGIFLVLLFGFFICSGEYNTLDDLIVSCFFVCFGLFISILCGISLYVNRKAYIHVDEQKISAYCHLGLSLECGLSDVNNVSYSYTGLNIQLKNGKEFNLMNLENAYQIGKYIQRRLPSKSTVPHDKDKLIAAIPSLRKKRKCEGIASICCFLLLFPGIFLTSALTGWKDLQEFSSYDWTVFTIMAGIGAIIVIMFCILLRSYLLHTDELNKMQGTLYQSILHTAPVQPGNAIKLYIDDDVYASFRLTVYSYPNSDEVYYTVEQVNQNFEIERIHESRIYTNIHELAQEIEGMTEIALP